MFNIQTPLAYNSFKIPKIIHILQYVGRYIVVFLINVTGFLGNKRRKNSEGETIGDCW